MRLDKYLADAGTGTRSEVKKMISKGRVEVNGIIASDPGMKVENGVDSIKADGKELSLSVYEYYMLNKPKGIVSASRKNSLRRGEKVPAGEERYAVDLIRESFKTNLFPAGRLDKDTEGLLLITNDGQLAHRLLSPKKHVDKTYYTELSGILQKADAERLEAGIDIGDEKPTKPCTVNILSDRSCLITLTEGRYHQIKRMFAVCGLKVTSLKRITFGPLALDNSLEPGEYRALNEEELSKLLSEYRS